MHSGRLIRKKTLAAVWLLELELDVHHWKGDFPVRKGQNVNVRVSRSHLRPSKGLLPFLFRDNRGEKCNYKTSRLGQETSQVGRFCGTRLVPSSPQKLTSSR